MKWKHCWLSISREDGVREGGRRVYKDEHTVYPNDSNPPLCGQNYYKFPGQYVYGELPNLGYGINFMAGFESDNSDRGLSGFVLRNQIRRVGWGSER